MNAPRPITSNRVRILWPDRGLSPNARVHHMKLYSLKKQAKAVTIWTCKLWKLERVSAPVHLSITFLPPDRRPRDLDNMFASFKAQIDGIAEYLGVNDSTFSFTISKGEPVKNGAVEIIVTGAS